MMVRPLLSVWMPFAHAACAFDWAEEPTPFRVPLRGAEAELPELADPPPLPAFGSFDAQLESAIMAVRAVPMAMPARRFFKR